MNEAISEERLNDYVDGLLSADDAAEVERCLAASAEARETVESLRSLRLRVAELPASIEPSRDLWPEIQPRLAAAPLVSADHPQRAAIAATHAWWPRLDTFQWATLAAAAMFLVITSSAITAWVVGVGEPTGTTAGAPDIVTATDVAVDDVPRIEAEYAAEMEPLVWALYENRDNLDPDTVSTIETSLRVIDRAIGRAREALDEDPGNPGLTRMLTNNYRRKLQLLQRTSRIIEWS